MEQAYCFKSIYIRSKELNSINVPDLEIYHDNFMNMYEFQNVIDTIHYRQCS